MINLKNKTVLITGGSRGIGEACVCLFAEAGASVGFTYKTAKKSADRLVKELSSKSKVEAFKVDLTNETEIKNTVSSFVILHLFILIFCYTYEKKWIRKDN